MRVSQTGAGTPTMWEAAHLPHWGGLAGRHFPNPNSQAVTFNLSSFSWSCKQPCPQGHWDSESHPQGALPGPAIPSSPG